MLKQVHWDIRIGKIVLDEEKMAFCEAIPKGNCIQKQQTSLIQWMLINTGIRVSELCSLRGKDTPVGLGANFIEVYKGKRGKSRNIPVSREFADMIRQYVTQIRPQTMPRRLGKQSLDGWLFYSKGKKMTRNQIYYLVKKTARAAGLTKPISPHMWRHRFATQTLAQDGSNIYLVKSWLGHSSIATTEKYLHLSGMLNNVDAGRMLDQMPQQLTRI